MGAPSQHDDEIGNSLNQVEPIEDVLAAILSSLPKFHLQVDEVLLTQDHVSDFAYFLQDGTVSVFAETLFGPVPLASLTGPLLIGEIGVLANLPRTASIKATTPITVYRLDRATLLDIGLNNPRLLLQIINQLGGQIAAINKAVGLYTNALAALEKHEFDSRILEELSNPPPQLAEFSRTFKRFASEIIDKRRKHDELASAALIQQSFLPKTAVLKQIARRLDFDAKMRPAREVGGDFYDCFMLSDDHLAITIGDVCGKGIGASLFMSVVVTILRMAALDEKDVASTIAKANMILCRDNAASMFATVFYGVLDLRSGMLSYCNCGHNAPYVVAVDGTVKALPATGLPLALFADRSAKVASLLLHPSDVLFLFTDGVTEAMNNQSQEFGEEDLVRELVNLNKSSVSEIIAGVFAAVDRFADEAEQADDITCIALRSIAAPELPLSRPSPM